jgi:hypothetical protein
MTPELLAEIRTVDLLALMNERAAGQVSGYLAALLAEVERLKELLREALAGEAVADGLTDCWKARVTELENGPALPWVAAMSDDDLHGFLDGLLSAAMGRWRSEPEVPDRQTLADIEKACAQWRTPGEGFRSDEPLAGSEAAKETADLTVYRAEHESFAFGLYTTPGAAREHCEELMRRELPAAVLDWIEDDEDGVAELVATIDGDERTTGYLVTELTVDAAYDPDGDE